MKTRWHNSEILTKVFLRSLSSGAKWLAGMAHKRVKHLGNQATSIGKWWHDVSNCQNLPPEITGYCGLGSWLI